MLWDIPTRTVGVVTCMALVVSPAVSLAQTQAQNQVRATRRTALLMSRSDLVPEARPTTSVVGSVWSPENEGVPEVSVRLRNLVLGEISAVTRTNRAGDFAFEQLREGTYLLEVRGGPRNSDSLLRWDPDPGKGVWHATEETELSCCTEGESRVGGTARGSNDGGAGGPLRCPSKPDCQLEDEGSAAGAGRLIGESRGASGLSGGRNPATAGEDWRARHCRSGIFSPRPSVVEPRPKSRDG